MDKHRARTIVAAAGVHVPDGELLLPGQRPTIAQPAVVKPVDADNSSGVTLVRSPEEYDAALHEAFRHSGAALVETYVELGREVRCGLIERGGELVCLPPAEYAMDPATTPIRGYDDKLARSSDGDLHLMAKDGERAWIVDPADPMTEPVWDAARACYAALGCRQYGLYCSFARTSVIAVMAEAADITLPDLFRSCVDAASVT